ncbi:hypothetical protein [Pseudonocardia endophytica]|uniref:Uncharacterized protein n=1 Tax=Pseudonocardia endophytica TaxID=401976 RepID=A0A4R1HTK8_PSEEN|nr:hypothetical protein [Pseudonocardia endophytica]TCK24663.1 hypothetical protein EV378_0447 [Pseudonocardia endophytica]
MATQELAEHVRRSHREAVEAFLNWGHTDGGPAEGRRQRYEEHLPGIARSVPRGHAPPWTATGDYCRLRSRTLTVEGH